MPEPISPERVRSLIGEADGAARRLYRRLGLQPADLDDLRQDLLLDLLRRLPAFDPSRGSIGAFTNVVLRNRSARIARERYRQLQLQGGPMFSLDAPIGDGDHTLGDALSEADGLTAWHGQDGDTEDRLLLRHDVANVIDALSADDGMLCASLATSPPAELVNGSGLSRSSLYRRIAVLRTELAMRGIAGRWDSSCPA